MAKGDRIAGGLKTSVLLLPTLDWRFWLEPKSKWDIWLLPLNLRKLAVTEELTWIICTRWPEEKDQRPGWGRSGSESWVCTPQEVVGHERVREEEPRLLFLSYLFIYFILAVLGIRCCAWAFSSCSEWDLLSSCSVWASHWGWLLFLQSTGSRVKAQ